MRHLSAATRTTVFVFLFAWLNACSSQPTPPAEPPPTPEERLIATKPLPELTTPATWDYVAIGGDFTYTQNWDQRYASYIEEDLGMPVNFSDLSTHDFMTWNGWLERLKNEEPLRSALLEAEAVTFDIPLEAYYAMPIAMYQNGLCGGEDGENCYRQRTEQLKQDLEAFLAELTTLADPRQVVVRTVLRGSIPAFYGVGVGEGLMTDFSKAEMQTLIKYMLAANEILRKSAAAHGIPAVDLPAVLQPDGPETQPAPEYLLMLGMSEAGDQVTAKLLREAGYEPSPQAEVVLTEDGCTLGVYTDTAPNPLQVRIENQSDRAAALVVVTLEEGASRYDILESTDGAMPVEVEEIISHPEPGPGRTMTFKINLEEGRANYFVCATPEKVLAVPGALTPGEAPQLFPAVRSARDLPYTRPVSPTSQEFKLDVYAPKQQGSYPVVVFLHSGKTPKDDPIYLQLFESLVDLGAVVYTAQSFTDSGLELARVNHGAGIRHDQENAACAVRYARATAADYGGDPGQVILIGHSGGGYPGLWVTLAGDQLEEAWGVLGQDTPPQQVECVAGQEQSPLPDGFIGFNGAFVYFDQMRSEDPELYQVLDPRTYVARNKDIPLLFIYGDGDLSYASFPWFKKGVGELVAMFQETGNNLEFELWEGVGQPVDSRSIPLFPAAFERILERMEAAAP